MLSTLTTLASYFNSILPSDNERQVFIRALFCLKTGTCGPHVPQCARVLPEFNLFKQERTNHMRYPTSVGRKPCALYLMCPSTLKQFLPPHQALLNPSHSSVYIPSIYQLDYIYTHCVWPNLVRHNCKNHRLPNQGFFFF